MTSSRMRNSRFDLLPLEILSMVADALGLDLVGHVVFSEFRKDFRNYYYEGRGRDFWEPLLRASGLSTTAEEDFDDKGWAELAVTCVRHVETCCHSQCGMARLKENRKLMDESIRDGIGIMDTVKPGSDAAPQLQPGGAYKGIAFKRPSSGFQNSRGDWKIFAFLNETPTDGLLRYGDKLENHPLIWRTFAVFPVATGLAASRGPSITVQNNELGNVIADILATIFRMDRREIPHEHFDQFMEKMEDEHDLVQNPITPRSWSLRSTFDALQSVQDWFILTRWKGIVEDTLEDDGEGESIL